MIYVIPSFKELEAYKKINKNIISGLILPYEEDIVTFLSSHGNGIDSNSYLELLCSSESVAKADTYINYLALAFINMNKPFKIYEGKVNLYKPDRDVTHTWIEVDDWVYDVTFIGKYPKELYYELFGPESKKEVDIESNEKLQEARKSMVLLSRKSSQHLQYPDWHEFYDVNLRRSYGMYFPYSLRWKGFPNQRDLTRESKMMKDYIYLLLDNTNNLDCFDFLPEEIFSLELSDFIDCQENISNKYMLYVDLIDFINENRDLYEEKKYKFNDDTLSKKIKEQNRSGLLAIFINNMPKILESIENNKKSKRSK